MRKILVTDSLFIFDEHVAQLREAGFEVTRLDKVQATEDELCAAIAGCDGYILGGIEQVTERVLAAAPDLKAIAFTGANYAAHIPAHEAATRRGIAITNCPGANATAVAEFTLALILSMVRQLPQLTRPGGKSFAIAPEFAELKVGVVGFGHIGRLVADKLRALSFLVIVHTRTQSDQVVAAGYNAVSLETLCQTSDIVTLHVDKLHGKNLLNEAAIDRLKPGAILINTCFDEAVDEAAVLRRCRAGDLFVAADPIHQANLEDIEPGRYVQTNAHIAYCTRAANQRASDMATQSLLNVLAGRDDACIVNPDFRKHRA